MLALLARFVHGLAHSLRSLPRGTVEIIEYVFTLLSPSTGTNAFFLFTRNTPSDTFNSMALLGLNRFNGLMDRRDIQGPRGRRPFFSNLIFPFLSFDLTLLISWVKQHETIVI